LVASILGYVTFSFSYLCNDGHAGLHVCVQGESFS